VITARIAAAIVERNISPIGNTAAAQV